MINDRLRDIILCSRIRVNQTILRRVRMKYYLILVLSIGSMHAMNKQVIPIDDAHAANSEKIVEDAVSGSSSSGSNVAAPGIQTATVLSDLELCRRAFPSINPSGHLIPHLAEHL